MPAFGIVDEGVVLHPREEVGEPDRPVAGPDRAAQSPPTVERSAVRVVALLEPDLLLGRVCEVLEDGSDFLGLVVHEGTALGELDHTPGAEDERDEAARERSSGLPAGSATYGATRAPGSPRSCSGSRSPPRERRSSGTSSTPRSGPAARRRACAPRRPGRPSTARRRRPATRDTPRGCSEAAQTPSPASPARANLGVSDRWRHGPDQPRRPRRDSRSFRPCSVRRHERRPRAARPPQRSKRCPERAKRRLR